MLGIHQKSDGIVGRVRCQKWQKLPTNKERNDISFLVVAPLVLCTLIRDCWFGSMKNQLLMMAALWFSEPDAFCFASCVGTHVATTARWNLSLCSLLVSSHGNDCADLLR